jgi:hypothetical protein
MTKRSKFPKGSVCKPCWELKYCPYGSLVEFFPHAHSSGNPKLIDTEHKRYHEVLTEIQQLSSVTPEIIEKYAYLLWLLDPQNNEFVAAHYYEVGCNQYGHSCPVFFHQGGATETKEGRAEGRHIPRNVMLKVVRRDNHVCQLCYTYVQDEQVEFDHIIPYSKGGPTTVENLRLLCRACNRKKSNSLGELLDNFHL